MESLEAIFANSICFSLAGTRSSSRAERGVSFDFRSVSQMSVSFNTQRSGVRVANPRIDGMHRTLQFPPGMLCCSDHRFYACRKFRDESRNSWLAILFARGVNYAAAEITNCLREMVKRRSARKPDPRDIVSLVRAGGEVPRGVSL